MRKYIRDQLLTLIQTMEQGDRFVMDCLKHDETADITTILEDERQSAITIKKLVEQSEGSDHVIIEQLNYYCELLRQCGREKIRDSQVKQCGVLIEECQTIEERLREEIPVQCEAVFLPYKASMWDSLESVWLAAKDESGWTCHVIPIPYFDRRADRSLGAMHYEAEKFPDYVPITPYHMYDLKNRHPEVIFIHNPYDEFNYVTSVHPSYYSSVIKAYTNLLVYIPYYITYGDVPEWHCTESGVINADLVIVQSEKVRQTYIRTLCRELGIDEKDGRLPGLNEKILAAGSPKIDKVLNTRSADIVLPDEWREKIYGEGNA